MKTKKGISLIVLVITIIVIIILAGSVILSLSENNLINSAKEAIFKSNLSEYINEISLNLANQYSMTSGNLDLSDINITNSDELKQYVKSISDSDINNFKIINGKLTYTGISLDEIRWVRDLDVELQVPHVSNNLVLWFDGSDFTNLPKTTTWIDKSGNGISGTVNNFEHNSTSGSDGNEGVVFDGVNDLVNVVPTDYNEITAEYVFKLNSYPVAVNSGLFGTASYLRYGYQIGVRNQKLDFGINALGTEPVISAGNINLNTVYHAVLVYSLSSKTLKAYLNGNLIGTKTNALKDISPLNLTIGNSNGQWGGFINNTLYLFRIYNRALSEDEVLQNYYSSINKGK